MTDIDKAKAYDAVVQQRDVYRDMLCDLIDTFRDACFNGFNELWKDKDGNPIKTFGVSLDDLLDKFQFCNSKGSYEMNNLISCFKKANAEILKEGLPAEIKKVIDKVIDFKKAKEELSHHEMSLEDQKKHYSMTDEELCYQMMTFFYEYQFGHNYPADENGIYEDVFRNMLLAVMSRCGVRGTKDEMLNFLSEYRNKQKDKK